MADSEALYGLLGAVGGALVAGVASVYGPLRVHRRQSQQRAEEERAGRLDAQVNRLITPPASRAWLDVLERTQQDLQIGQPLNIAEFDRSINEITQQTNAAGHALGQDGLWLASNDTPPHGVNLWGSSRTPDDGVWDAYSQLLGRLRQATYLEHLTQCGSQAAPADQRTTDSHECFMDVVADL
ncbi:hypothetical protein, partial [Streptomyces mobaraensis]